jgi:hypothetical protein
MLLQTGSAHRIGRETFLKRPVSPSTASSEKGNIAPGIIRQ